MSSQHLSDRCFSLYCPLVPPYGASEANLQTIFEVKHLSKTSYFLDTQCEHYHGFTTVDLLRPDITASDRLPVPLGGFISETIYESKLHSSHNIVDHPCIVFIDVKKGREARQGKSYKASIPR